MIKNSLETVYNGSIILIVLSTTILGVSLCLFFPFLFLSQIDYLAMSILVNKAFLPLTISEGLLDVELLPMGYNPF